MSARQKLNQAYCNGALIFAICFGYLCESWSIFWLALIFSLLQSLHAGEIRPSRGHKSSRS